ncbi:hypothetical protein BC937DRAFT_93008 [Endogone sp. FLAS-F59071]|nr:hypothetical protein BC937DRAFT_93008 [Endogone sp. FLAS-F59071]|eukprot:RUS23053.1 hypothetical protein BC937DRAFT_93008 [Endogone sp. FLAS-F59071]
MGRMIKAVIMGTGIVGLGYALMKLTVPNDQQFIEKLPPQFQREARQKLEESAKKNEALVELIKSSAESSKPVYESAPKKS